MGWQIGRFYNDVKVADKQKYVDTCEKHDHYIYPSDSDVIEFDTDAMEHSDHCWDEWSKEMMKELKANGTVIWGSIDGDNSGKLWGYQYIEGDMYSLDMRQSLIFLLSNS